MPVLIAILLGLATVAFLLSALEVKAARFDLTSAGLLFLTLAVALMTSLCRGAI
jgi:hypothetical protein